MVGLEDMRTYAVARSLFAPVTLQKAIEKLNFLQADPIRAPARAQDLILRQRVRDYRAGDLEQRYARLPIEEDFYVNYGFMPRALQALMHPRSALKRWTPTTKRRASDLLAFVKEHGAVHPREVDAHFAHGSVTNYWGGASNATTHLLDGMHYRGLLRIVRRDRGVRVYGLPREDGEAPSKSEQRGRLDRLIDAIISTYAPMPTLSLNALLSRMRFATPQWRSELKPAIARAKTRLAHTQLDGSIWYWPAHERLEQKEESDDRVRLLAPFDPVVWDRRRFELFFGFPYRFEAYTPLAKRRFGYYALPLLFRGRVLGWANLSYKDGTLSSSFGYVAGHAPRVRVFARELEAELLRMRTFLGP
jgi:uncharacterized protein YcaQ